MKATGAFVPLMAALFFLPAGLLGVLGKGLYISDRVSFSFREIAGRPTIYDPGSARLMGVFFLLIACSAVAVSIYGYRQEPDAGRRSGKRRNKYDRRQKQDEP